MTRMMVMTFWGKERFRETHDSKHRSRMHHHGPVEPHESPWLMTVPLIVLAVLSTVGGFIGVPYALSLFTIETSTLSSTHLNRWWRQPARAQSRTCG